MKFFLTSILFFWFSGNVLAIDFNAGPLFDQHEANHKCPAVCASHGKTWNGQWRTTHIGRMSVCGCTSSCGDLRAGPIWNNDDAKGKCPAVCASHNGEWQGQWRTIIEGRESVCACTNCN